VLGPPQYAATRINLAQSTNGIGLLLGPIAGGAFFYSKNAAGLSTGSERLWIPYAFIGVIVIILAIVFFFAPMPDIEMEDDYHLDDSTPNVSHSIWSHPHFWMAVLAQFLYVAAQAGIFSFFINYMTSQVPPVPDSWRAAGGFFSGWFETHANGALGFSNKAASNLASLGFLCFLIGRFTGSAILKKFAAHSVLGIYSVAAVVLCLLIFAKLGWVSVACVFLTYFFMSIMFPTIFALGIFGLGQRAKRASSFIVMAIMGGAILPKVMGAVADRYDLSRGFIVPMLCFAFVAFYGFVWPRLSNAEGMTGVSTTGGH
jgi:FHS family L-fucose permease-like MFS transporter